MTPISNNAFPVNGATLLLAKNQGSADTPVNIIINNTSAGTVYVGFSPNVGTGSFAIASTLSLTLTTNNLPVYLYSGSAVAVNVLVGT